MEYQVTDVASHYESQKALDLSQQPLPRAYRAGESPGPAHSRPCGMRRHHRTGGSPDFERPGSGAHFDEAARGEAERVFRRCKRAATPRGRGAPDRRGHPAAGGNAREIVAAAGSPALGAKMSGRTPG